MNKSVLAIKDKKGAILGTGFVVRNTEEGIYVATCGHVLSEYDESTIVETEEAKLIDNKYKEGLDLAILFVAGLDIEPFKLADAKNSKKVEVIGYSRFSGTCKKEAISNIEVKKLVEIGSKNSMKLYPKEDISDGYSGSPVICQDSLHVVGVVTHKQGNENYAISSEYLAELLGIDLLCSPKRFKKKLTSKLSEIQIEINSSKLNDRLDKALATYSTQKNFWVNPHVDTNEEEKKSEGNRIEIDSLVKNPRSILIHSKHQYGTTSLAHYLIKEAWGSEDHSFWLYFDAGRVKPHKKEIEKEVKKQLSEFKLTIDDVECVIIDEFSTSISDGKKLLKEFHDIFKELPIILLKTSEDNPLVNESLVLPREFENLYLWSLDRTGVRALVSSYNSEGHLAEETKVLNKVVGDLEALNIPRTPQNCLTILKISERDFDDSPVNRAEMIGRVLHLLFNVDEIPKYKTRPDLKDTEFTLGFFCQRLLIDKKMYFTRNEFISTLASFCHRNEIDLEVSVIFDILASNNILVSRNSGFCFKFTYWIYYFSAHRMLHDSEFSDYILNDRNYINYPELIEFYTGIDRRRSDAISVITKDLIDIEKTVNTKCSLPEDFEIYDLAKWLPTVEQLDIIGERITNSVAASGLPDEIKDEYADRYYDRSSPQTQDIRYILEEYSLLRLMQCIKAGSLALRNSDFVSKELKHKLLDAVLQGIHQLTNVLVALSPVLAENNKANVEGASFVLTGSFSEKPETKFNEIIGCIPSNMIDWYVDKLFSQKMGTLVKNKINIEKNAYKRHYLHLLAIAKRPSDWEKLVSDYILSVDKNSFYLLDTLRCLQSEYSYSYASEQSIGKMGDLIKLCLGKHTNKLIKPNIKKASNLPDYLLPDRKN